MPQPEYFLVTNVIPYQGDSYVRPRLKWTSRVALVAAASGRVHRDRWRGCHGRLRLHAEPTIPTYSFTGDRQATWDSIRPGSYEVMCPTGTSTYQGATTGRMVPRRRGRREVPLRHRRQPSPTGTARVGRDGRLIANPGTEADHSYSEARPTGTHSQPRGRRQAPLTWDTDHAVVKDLGESPSNPFTPEPLTTKEIAS